MTQFKLVGLARNALILSSLVLTAASGNPSLAVSLPTGNGNDRTPNFDRLISQVSLASLEKAVHTQVNQYRTSKGLRPLVLDNRISEQARLHSQAMANRRVPFSHQGFQQRVQAIARAVPYQSAAENVAYNQGYRDPDRQAVQGWIQSSGHRSNMEGQFDLTGIGIARNNRGEFYFTQIFIRRR